MRLTGSRQFETVYKANVRARVGPLVVWALPNDLGHHRLGLAVPRRVGPAVARNRIKRLLRESFRGMGPQTPAGYDLVISVRRHETRTLAEYREDLRQATRSLHETWSRKLDKKKNGR